tara:strand:+ start:1593 stop:2201 length:609 start_codon:yes stop_codon:yes gene_type:complete
MKTWIFDSQFVGSISYYKLLSQAKNILIDHGEHFVKSTNRNRAKLPGPNNVLLLSVPLKNGKHQRKAMKDIQISYDHPWQKLHWKTLCACYQSSPYFEFYEAELKNILDSKHNKLIELNKEILDWVMEKIQLELKIEYTNDYILPVEPHILDLRSSRKESYSGFNLSYTPYIQVFEDRLGFQADMSILDLLFNEGPNTISFL